MADLFRQRFSTLATEADALDDTKRPKQHDVFGTQIEIEEAPLEIWLIKARHLIEMACGAETSHLRAFDEKSPYQMYDRNLDRLLRARAVFNAAKDDYENGMFSSARALVQAEVFDDELEQASELLRAGYHVAAAVIAGTVLETTLRAVCKREAVQSGKVEDDERRVGQKPAYTTRLRKST